MRNTDTTNTKTVLIKKYSNRRLYHAAEKRYITLQDISDIIKKGDTIKAVDTKSKEDITKTILIQVILENEKNKKDILPVPFLHKLIRYGNKLSKEYLENSFIMMMQPYLNGSENKEPDNMINIFEYKKNIHSSDDIKDINLRMEQLEQKIRELNK